ncbi:unnamed protein product, partial [Vitis vinifera]|uniref:Uncharacterized protein n=1 Tax=Vitis vinifera TaxID=29760 RepID=D7SUB2_VITVI
MQFMWNACLQFGNNRRTSISSNFDKQTARLHDRILHKQVREMLDRTLLRGPQQQPLGGAAGNVDQSDQNQKCPGL